jgi:hypothetical protein
MRKIKNHLDQVRKSLKMREVEEGYDIYFSRFFGLHLARIAKGLRLTPTQVTLLSLISGVLGGLMLYFQGQWIWMLIAGILITLAGLLDSADGQLARMTGKSTELGRILDGAADSIVFIACYVGATSWFVFNQPNGWLLIPLAVAAGYLHTLKACVYDLYKSEVLYYVGGFEDYRVESVKEIQDQLGQKSGFERLMYFLYTDYLRKQHMGSARKLQFDKFRGYYQNESTKQAFVEAYRIHQIPLLKIWAWVGGTNVHRWAIIVFSFIGRFDLFLWIALISSISLVWANFLQKRADLRIVEVMTQKSN